MRMVAHYNTLGLPQTATKEEVKRAYRKLSLKYHPDMPTGNADKYISIKTAYEELIKFDPTKVHDQYQHRTPPIFHPYKVRQEKNGDILISVTLRNILYVEVNGSLDYMWNTYGYTDGTLRIKKKDVIKYNFSIEFRALTAQARTMRHHLTVEDKRTKWQKFIDKWYNIFFVWTI